MRSLTRMSLALLFAALLSSIGLAQSGVISTVAGNGTHGFGGGGQLNWPDNVAVDTAGNVSIVDLENHPIRKVTVKTSAATFFSQEALGGLVGNSESGNYFTKS